MKKSARAGLVVICLACIGCGGDAAKIAVRGAVTLDDEPVVQGAIQFYPTDGVGPTSGGVIENGDYQFDAPPGKMRVVITSPRAVGQRKMYNTPDAPLVDVERERIPARYNAKSQLVVEVSKQKAAFDFDLKTRAK